eukprot:6557951-Alexandrium_andersonii.AAC.1
MGALTLAGSPRPCPREPFPVPPRKGSPWATLAPMGSPPCSSCADSSLSYDTIAGLCEKGPPAS